MSSSQDRYSGSVTQEDEDGPQPSGCERTFRQAPPRNPSDLRRSNKDDRSRSPEIDDDVTGKELDRDAARQLKSLNEGSRSWVAKHLVMAGRLIDVDPSLACEHAVAASRRGGRLAVVREAAGLTAYAAEDYPEALRELRTYRRISGDQRHLAVMVDALRGIGKPEKALELAAEPQARGLTGQPRAELAIVVAGIHRDRGDSSLALNALEIPELDINRAYSFSPRLFSAYALALEPLGRSHEAQEWWARVSMAEHALGTGVFADPEIMDFDDEVSASLPEVSDLVHGAANGSPSSPSNGAREKE